MNSLNHSRLNCSPFSLTKMYGHTYARITNPENSFTVLIADRTMNHPLRSPYDVISDIYDFINDGSLMPYFALQC